MFTATDLATILKNTPSGYRTPQDDFFVCANKSLLVQHKKLGVINAAEEDADVEKQPVIAAAEIFCNVPGCQLRFAGVSAFQTHFNSVHRFHCAECRRALPTAHLLDLHLSEQHDSYFEASMARGTAAMYACLLEECKERHWTPELRKTHCIQTHKFPANFRFDQLSGSASGGSKNKKLKPKKAENTNAAKESTMEEESTMDAMETTESQSVADEPAVAASQLKGFSFGHQTGGKTFHTQRGRRKAGKTLDNLQALKDALEDI